MSGPGVGGSRRRIEWDEPMLAALVALRTRKPKPVPLKGCADRIGVHVSVVTRKAHELGLAEPIRGGPQKGSAVGRVRNRLGRFT